ncbi:hypothetical protein LCGC14_1400840 [marine sediment metagenome]|uniref:Uncharacterized protein n=1 Tax=marine sediment metagenome TaxID=412755 RepID=A0A0F9MYP4_9ZZZZ
MSNKWEKQYEASLEKSPTAFFFRILFRIILPIILVCGLVFGVIGHACNWFGEAATVAREEFGPRAMLKKYEWFKDAAAALDKKRADVGVYDARVLSLKEGYADTPRKDWAREDREQVNVWSSEKAGIVASYNGLAAEYNAAMAKFNWRFAEAGDLPKGADVPLPREFKPYISK